MSTSTTVPEQPLGHLTQEAEALSAHRASYVKGLRDLAAFLETHPDVPVPRTDTIGTSPWNWSEPQTAEAFTAAATVLQGQVEQRDFGVHEVLVARAFGPLRYVVCVEEKLVTRPRPVQRVEHVLPLELLRLGKAEADAGEDPAGNWSLAECGLDRAEATS